MSWKDTLLDLIVEKDETKSAPAAPVRPAASTAPTVSLPVSPQISIAPDNEMSSNFVEKLRGKLATSPMSSVLQQFDITLNSLGDIISEEGSRYRAAFKVLAGQSGLEANKLTEAYQSLVSILDSEAEKFKNAVQGQTANEITSREQQINGINGQIEEKNNEIKSLIEQRDTVATQVVEQRLKLSSRTTSFDGAQTTLRNEIADKLNKLRIYLPSAPPRNQ